MSISQAVTEHLMQESKQLPTVEIWVSCGENFINPVIADQLAQVIKTTYTEINLMEETDPLWQIVGRCRKMKIVK